MKLKLFIIFNVLMLCATHHVFSMGSLDIYTRDISLDFSNFFNVDAKKCKTSVTHKCTNVENCNITVGPTCIQQTTKTNTSTSKGGSTKGRGRSSNATEQPTSGGMGGGMGGGMSESMGGGMSESMGGEYIPTEEGDSETMFTETEEPTKKSPVTITPSLGIKNLGPLEELNIGGKIKIP